MGNFFPQTGTVSDSGLEVEYQVPTSSQRDHDDDNVIVVESDDEGGADEGEGADDEQDDPDTEGYDVETMVSISVIMSSDTKHLIEGATRSASL